MDRSRDLNDTVVTLAHELGHSLGSKHDEDVGIPVLFFFLQPIVGKEIDVAEKPRFYTIHMILRENGKVINLFA